MVITLLQSVNIMPDWIVLEDGQAVNIADETARQWIAAGIAVEGGVVLPSTVAIPERTEGMPQRGSAASETATAMPQRKRKGA